MCSPTTVGPTSDRGAAVWSDEVPRVFGLLCYGYPTHLAYRLDGRPGGFDPAGIVAGGRDFYFDAGQTTEALWAASDEMRRVFIEPDLLG